MTSIGGNATFSVAASSCSPLLSYQWWSKTGQIDGATDYILPLANVQLDDAGYYYVTVSTPWSSINSVPARLTVLIPPEITDEPVGQTVCAGATVHFHVTATGFPLSYHWKKGGAELSDGGNISGSATPTLTVANVSSTDAATYTVTVSNGDQSDSANAALVVSATCIAPTITTAPQNRTVTEGAIVSFTVVVDPGAGQPLSYQWQKGGVNLVDSGKVFGATTGTLTLQGVTAADAGTYTVIVSNGGGFDNASATLSVSGSCGVTFTQQPANWSASLGGTATFSVTVQESGVTYQWLKDTVNLSDGDDISGVNTPTLILNNISSADAGRYTVYVSNGSCSVASQPATLTVDGFKVRITEPKENAILP